jgi:hypothetical protein
MTPGPVWPGCTLPKRDDLVDVDEAALEQLPQPQLRQFATQLGLGLSGASAPEVLKTIKSAELDEQARGYKGQR